ncbi:hypothetical protein [Methylobacterium radiodurans]|uniref:PilZ domain-containing protein n=1 Tax=Methylobacterium radiodurans TaxID=2202828 RepID=A0A2U8VY73_9HYPH|nr:hypothetical protein [Methylobacterium radiodurans]AWN38116.1 hypothetical protein DK427_22210 [Methylobacterium radiodurans]
MRPSRANGGASQNAATRTGPHTDDGPARILTGDATVPCRLRPEGRAARLSLPSAAGIPEFFVLSDEASGDERLARVICRKQGADGALLWVDFLGPARLAA